MIQTDDHFIYVSTSQRLDAPKVKKGYRFPKNIWSCRELFSRFSAFQTELKEIGLQLRAEQDSLLAIRKQTAPILQGLREYQNQDVHYLKHLDAAGIFNEQRTGKTPTAIQLLQGRALIVCPASLTYNWQREIDKWTGQQATVISGKKRTYDNADILIVSKDTLKQDIDKVSQEFDVVIVDEAHFLRNYQTAQSKALFKLKAKKKYALTGTPTVKHPADIFGILHFLNPKQYPSYWQFVERYFYVEDNYLGYKEVGKAIPERLAELQGIVGMISTQRKRKDVMAWLPDKQRTTFYCEMSSKQRKAYNEMLEYFFVEDTDVDASTVLTQLIRLRQLCTEPHLLGLDVPSAKTDALTEWLENNDGSVVIMSMFTSYLKHLQGKLKGRIGMIHGEMSNREKMEQAEQFQRGEIDVLLCNIISAGTGFTLDRAETIIFMDKAWNPAENEQAEDRITPTTQDKLHKHEIISFVCQDSIDERINQLLDQKKSLTDLVNEGGLQAIKHLLHK